MPILDFDPKKVPSLTTVCFGSETCEFISFSVLEKAATGVLKLVAGEKYEQKVINSTTKLTNRYTGNLTGMFMQKK